jgi:phosphomannomutase
MHIDHELKEAAITRGGALTPCDTMAGMKVLRVETLDGIKFFLENPACGGKPNAAETWLLLRASGTEPLLRVYCESCSTDSVKQILEAARQFVLEGRAS